MSQDESSRLRQIIDSLLEEDEPKDEDQRGTQKQAIDDILNLPWEPVEFVLDELIPGLEDLAERMSDDQISDTGERLYQTLQKAELERLPDILFHVVNWTRHAPKTRIHQLWKVYDFCCRLEKSGQTARRLSYDPSQGSQLSQGETFCEERQRLEFRAKLIRKFILSPLMHDRGIAKDFIKLYKQSRNVPEMMLTPFGFACGVALTGHNLIADSMISELRMLVKRYYSDLKLYEISFWYRKVASSSEDCGKDVLDESIPDLVSTTKSRHMDASIDALSRVGFALIDTLPNFLNRGQASHLISRPVEACSSHEAACRLGQHIIKNMLAVHSNSHKQNIIRQLFKRIEQRASSNPGPYVEVLASAILQAPTLLLDMKEIMLEIIEYIPHFSYPHAIQISRVIMPLLKINHKMRAILIDSLSRSLHARNEEMRRVGVAGFLMAVKHFHLEGSIPWSQTQSSMPSSLRCTESLISSGSQLGRGKSQRQAGTQNDELCTDFLRILQRCLQGPELRQQLYEGFYSIILRNSELSGIIAELLLNQFTKYFNKDDPASFPILQLDRCVGLNSDNQVILFEPIGALIMSIQVCDVLLRERTSQKENKSSRVQSNNNQDPYEIPLSQYNQENQHNNTEHETMLLADRPEELRRIFNLFVDRLCKAELEDFGLEESAPLSHLTPDGKLNRAKAVLLYSILEATTEYIYLTRRSDQSIGTVILRFQEHMTTIKKRLSTGSANKQNKTKRTKQDKKAPSKKRRLNEAGDASSNQGPENPDIQDENSMDNLTIVGGSQNSDATECSRDSDSKVDDAHLLDISKPLISLKCATQIILDLFIESEGLQQSVSRQKGSKSAFFSSSRKQLSSTAIKSLNQNEQFICFLVSLINHRVTDFLQSGSPDAYTCDEIKRAFDDFILIGIGLVSRLYTHMTQIIDEVSLAGEDDDYFDGSLAATCAETLHNLIKAVCERYPTKFVRFICKIFQDISAGRDINQSQNGSQASSTSGSQASSRASTRSGTLVRTCKEVSNALDCLMDLSRAALKNKKSKYASHFLDATLIVVRHLIVISSNGLAIGDENNLITLEKIQVLCDWSHECMMFPIETSQVAKSAFTVMIELANLRPTPPDEENNKDKRTALRLLGVCTIDLHKCYGDLDDSVTLEHQKTFPSINKEKTVGTIFGAVLQQLETALGHIKLAIERLLTLVSHPSTSGRSIGSVELGKFDERHILDPLSQVLNVYFEIIAICIPQNLPSLPGIWTGLKAIYNLILEYIQFYLELPSKKHIHVHPLFTKIIHRLTGEFTDRLNNFFIHCEDDCIDSQEPGNTPQRDRTTGNGSVGGSTRRRDDEPLISKGGPKAWRRVKDLPEISLLRDKLDNALTNLDKRTDVGLMEKHVVFQPRDLKWKNSK